MYFLRTAALFTLIAGALGAAALSLHTQPLQPAPYGNAATASQRLLHMVAVDGPRQTAETLTREQKWGELQLAITSGQPETSRLLPVLMPLANSTTTRSLLQSARFALATHPAVILAATSQDSTSPLTTAALCKPAGMNSYWRNSVQQAISALHDGELASRAKHCQETLSGKPSTS